MRDVWLWSWECLTNLGSAEMSEGAEIMELSIPPDNVDSCSESISQFYGCFSDEFRFLADFQASDLCVTFVVLSCD